MCVCVCWDSDPRKWNLTQVNLSGMGKTAHVLGRDASQKAKPLVNLSASQKENLNRGRASRRTALGREACLFLHQLMIAFPLASLLRPPQKARKRHTRNRMLRAGSLKGRLRPEKSCRAQRPEDPTRPAFEFQPRGHLGSRRIWVKQGSDTAARSSSREDRISWYQLSFFLL